VTPISRRTACSHPRQPRPVLELGELAGAAGEPDRIRPREPEDRRVTLTAERQRLPSTCRLLVIPGLAFLIGFATWWRRR